MASIKDVAKQAGVSIATVSNVYNDSPKVKDATRAKVLRAAAELNYPADSGADAQKTKLNRIIGVITEEITEFNTPAIISALSESAEEKGWDLLFCDLGILRTAGTYDFDDAECISAARKSLNLLLSKDVDGIIYVGCKTREIKKLSEGYNNTPVVYTYCYSRDPNAPSVVYDNEKIAYKMTRYLIEMGHKKIGIIAGKETNIQVRDRLIGVQKAHFEAGILYNPGNIKYGDWERSASGYECMPALLDNNITAVFCLNDTIAGGVYDYALSHGIRIPQDLTVVGFDNQLFSTVLYPKLTTVGLPLQEIGHEAIGQMERILCDRNYIPSPNLVVMDCELVLRDSVADLRK